MRILGVDFGQRRIGLALSDPSGTLARPWKTIGAGQSPVESARLVAQTIHESAEDDGQVTTAVVGVPRRLNGSDTDQTTPAREFAAALRQLGLTIDEQDERLTSHEADALLALQERD